MNDKIKLLRPKEVIQKLSISKSTFYDWQNKNRKDIEMTFLSRSLLVQIL